MMEFEVAVEYGGRDRRTESLLRISERDDKSRGETLASGRVRVRLERTGLLTSCQSCLLPMFTEANAYTRDQQ